jgi:hypothetical protein
MRLVRRGIGDLFVFLSITQGSCISRTLRKAENRASHKLNNIELELKLEQYGALNESVGRNVVAW